MVRENLGFQGERLREIRTWRELDQETLAKKLDRTQAAISGWENGKQSPDATSISRLSAALNVEPCFFYKPALNPLRPHFFRDLAKNTAFYRKKSITQIKWMELVYDEVSEWVDFPEFKAPVTFNQDYRTISNEDIEQAAATCRSAWGLGSQPIQNVLRVVEDAGIIVARAPLGAANMDGLSCWMESEKRPIILVASDKNCAVRSRFDIAHELGHIILHNGVSKEEFESSKNWKQIETQAHRFASALLMPPDSFADSVWGMTLDDFVQIKANWKVAISAAIIRCSQLELIPEEYKTRLYKMLSARGWRKREPFDDDWAPEMPSLMMEGISLLFESKTLSPSELANKVGLPLRDIEKAFGFENGSLNYDGFNRASLKNEVNNKDNIIKFTKPS